MSLGKMIDLGQSHGKNLSEKFPDNFSRGVVFCQTDPPGEFPSGLVYRIGRCPNDQSDGRSS